MRNLIVTNHDESINSENRLDGGVIQENLDQY